MEMPFIFLFVVMAALVAVVSVHSIFQKQREKKIAEQLKNIRNASEAGIIVDGK